MIRIRTNTCYRIFMNRYWIGVASREHVKSGVEQGIAQVCHGKAYPLNQMKEGDWLVYYSPVIKFGGKEPCQSFTAIGEVKKGTPYLFKMSEDFIPWRRDVAFYPAYDVPIKPLLDRLSFITDKTRWGYPFRRGCFEIARHDFITIAKEMGCAEYQF